MTKQRKTFSACDRNISWFNLSDFCFYPFPWKEGLKENLPCWVNFLSQRCAEQMLETDACDISQSGIIKGLVWMTACATFAQLLKHRESDVKLIHPGAIIQWWWYFAIRVLFMEKTSSPASEMTHGSRHISLVFETRATVSSPAVQLLVWQQKVCKYVKQAYVNLCK